MKRLFLAIAIVLIGLTAFTADPPGTKIPIGLVVGAGKTKTVIDTTEIKALNGITGNIKDTLDSKISTSTLGSSLDEFYNKTQSNARFINEAGDTITGDILIPTQAEGDNSLKAANTAFVDRAVTKGVMRCIYSRTVPVSVTGVSTETTAFTVTIPGGELGAHGQLQIWWDLGSAATTATIYRAKVGSDVIGYISLTTNNRGRYLNTMDNTGSESTQILGWANTTSGGVFTQVASDFPTRNIDTSQPFTITFTITPTTTSDVAYFYKVRIFAVYMD